MRTQNAVIAALLGLGLLVPAPAMAQAPNLGPDWELVGTRKVKTWIPHPTKPGNGKWEMVDFNTYRLFQENLANPKPAEPAPQSPDILLGDIKKGKAFDEKKEIERVRRGLLIHKYQTIVNVTPQTRTETTVRKGWQLSEFTRNETRSRTLRTKYGLYDISFQVPVKNYRWDTVETGRSSRELTLDPILVPRIVELLPPDRASEVSALAAPGGDRPGTFRGDSGSGGMVSLSASKLRDSLGANQVKASEAVLTAEQIEEARLKAEEEARRQLEEESKRKAEEEAARKRAAEEAAQTPTPDDDDDEDADGPGLTLARVKGEWISSGGKSKIEIKKAGKSGNMKVDAKIVLSRDKYDDDFTVPFGKSWQGQIGKDGLAKVYLKSTFNDAGTQMSVKIWRDGLFNTTLAEGTFTKKKK